MAESREVGTGMARVEVHPVAPGSAEACEAVGRDGRPVREGQMAGKGEGMVTAADPGECLGPAGCNKAAAPVAAHNHLVPAVRMPSIQMSSTTLIRLERWLDRFVLIKTLLFLIKKKTVTEQWIAKLIKISLRRLFFTVECCLLQ